MAIYSTPNRIQARICCSSTSFCTLLACGTPKQLQRTMQGVIIAACHLIAVLYKYVWTATSGQSQLNTVTEPQAVSSACKYAPAYTLQRPDGHLQLRLPASWRINVPCQASTCSNQPVLCSMCPALLLFDISSATAARIHHPHAAQSLHSSNSCEACMRSVTSVLASFAQMCLGCCYSSAIHV